MRRVAGRIVTAVTVGTMVIQSVLAAILSQHDAPDEHAMVARYLTINADNEQLTRLSAASRYERQMSMAGSNSLILSRPFNVGDR